GEPEGRAGLGVSSDPARIVVRCPGDKTRSQQRQPAPAPGYPQAREAGGAETIEGSSVAHAPDLWRARSIRQATPAWLSPARDGWRGIFRQEFSKDRSHVGVAGLSQAALDIGAVHDAAHRFATEPLAPGIELRDKCRENLIGRP